MVHYDNQIVDQLQAARQAVADAKADLETNQAEQVQAKTDLESQQAELSTCLLYTSFCTELLDLGRQEIVRLFLRKTVAIQRNLC